MSALLVDLQAKGLLSQTLVILATEFDRTPASTTATGGTDTTSCTRACLPTSRPGGLLDQPLVVLATEFGRTPRINDNDGRDDERLHAPAGWGWDQQDYVIGWGTPTETTSRGPEGKRRSWIRR